MKVGKGCHQAQAQAPWETQGRAHRAGEKILVGEKVGVWWGITTCRATIGAAEASWDEGIPTCHPLSVVLEVVGRGRCQVFPRGSGILYALNYEAQPQGGFSMIKVISHFIEVELFLISHVNPYYFILKDEYGPFF